MSSFASTVRVSVRPSKTSNALCLFLSLSTLRIDERDDKVFSGNAPHCLALSVSLSVGQSVGFAISVFRAVFALMQYGLKTMTSETKKNMLAI